MKRILAAAGALCALAMMTGVSAAAPAPCDRTCQTGIVDQFLAALVAHDAKKAPLAKTVRYTENGQDLALGDGFWGTASGIGIYKHYFTDPDSGNVGYFGTMTENGVLVILVARLHIDGKKIDEIETIVSRPSGTGGLADGPKMMDAIGTTESDLVAADPRSRTRHSRRTHGDGEQVFQRHPAQ